MARSSNSSACACAGIARTRPTSASVKGAKMRRAVGLAGAAAAVGELFRWTEKGEIRHAIKPIIPVTMAKNTPTDAVVDVLDRDGVNTWPDVGLRGRSEEHTSELQSREN